MNTFYTHIQPNIIRFSDNEELPENLRCHYVINYNVWGIDYFFENYLLQESDDGTYLLLNENRFNFLLEDSLSDMDIIDIPRLYILITDEFMEDSSKFQEFIFAASKQSSIYANGIPGFRPGKQYFLNTTLFNYLANSNLVQYTDPDTTDNDENEGEYNPVNNRLPNYLDENANITKYFVDLSDDIIKDYTKLEYFNKKNILLENTFDEDTLNNFYKNFCQLIITYSEIQQYPDIYNKPKNQIYDLVLNYYGNSQVDNASIALNLILNSNYNTVSTTQQTCGCQSTLGGSVQSITESCSSLYSQAMFIYLKQMLSDVEFYNDWFTIILSDDETIPNDILIENLKVFINEFISLDYNLDFTVTNVLYDCTCINKQAYNNSSIEYKKLNNYLMILDWVNNFELDANTNKIKVYGEAFAELLPKLQF